MPSQVNTPTNQNPGENPFAGFTGGSSGASSNQPSVRPNITLDDDDDDFVPSPTASEEQTPTDNDIEQTTSSDTDEKPKLPKFDDFLNAGIPTEETKKKDEDDKGDHDSSKASSDAGEGEKGKTVSGQDGGQGTLNPKAQGGDKTPRDYSGLNPDEVPLFKRMSNEAFAKVKPVYLEARAVKEENAKLKARLEAAEKGKTVLPDNYYEHPQGYLLTPEYSQASRIASEAETIYNHWQQQLINIRRGKDWQDLDVDPKTGRLVVSEAQPSNEEAELAVTNHLEHARTQLFERRKYVESIQNGFLAKHNEAYQTIKNAEEQFFPGYDKPDHPYAGVMKEVVEKLPAPYRSHPLASLLAKTVAVNAALKKLATDVKAEYDKVTNIKRDAIKAGPTGTAFSGSPSGRTMQKLPSFTDFEEAKRA